MGTMTFDQQEAARRERLSEVGTEPPCPFCQKPRVKRSDYIRCNPCGTNWLQGENIFKDPRASRMPVTTPMTAATKESGVQTAEFSTEASKR